VSQSPLGNTPGWLCSVSKKASNPSGRVASVQVAHARIISDSCRLATRLCNEKSTLGHYRSEPDLTLCGGRSHAGAGGSHRSEAGPLESGAYGWVPYSDAGTYGEPPPRYFDVCVEPAFSARPMQRWLHVDRPRHNTHAWPMST